MLVGISSLGHNIILYIHIAWLSSVMAKMKNDLVEINKAMLEQCCCYSLPSLPGHHHPAASTLPSSLSRWFPFHSMTSSSSSLSSSPSSLSWPLRKQGVLKAQVVIAEQTAGKKATGRLPKTKFQKQIWNESQRMNNNDFNDAARFACSVFIHKNRYDALPF